MSSVGSVIAQRPFQAKNFTIFSTGAFAWPTSSIENAAPTAPSGVAVTGNVIVFQSNVDASSGQAGYLLTGGGDLLTTSIVGTLVPGIGGQLRDMGRYVHVYVGGVKVYTLALVQNMRQAAPGTSEGVGGLAPSSGTAEGYNTFYVAVENDSGGAYVGTNVAGSATGSVGIIGIARVF